jgi:hypothetical protein
VARAATLAARLLNYSPLSTACRAGLTDLEEPSAANHDTATAARFTRGALRARRCARPAALVTRLRESKLNIADATENRLVEIDIETKIHIVTATRRIRIGIASLTSAAAEEALEAACAAAPSEEIAEHGEDIIHAHTAAAKAAEALAAYALMAELIITLTLLGIMENVISLGRLFKLLLGLFIAGIAVGVVLHRQFAVGRLDLVGGRALGNAQYLVIISLLSHRQKTLYQEALPELTTT